MSSFSSQWSVNVIALQILSGAARVFSCDKCKDREDMKEDLTLCVCVYLEFMWRLDRMVEHQTLWEVFRKWAADTRTHWRNVTFVLPTFRFPAPHWLLKLRPICICLLLFTFLSPHFYMLPKVCTVCLLQYIVTSALTSYVKLIDDMKFDFCCFASD